LRLMPCSRVEPIDQHIEVAPSFNFEKRLLLLDDSATNLILNAQLLRSLGFEVITARSGGEAIQLAEQSNTPFDVALLDINLPDMTGHEVAQRLGKLPQCANTILLALSAYSQEEEKQKALSSGMVGFVTKPFKRDAIAAEFSSLFGSQTESLGNTDCVAETKTPLFDPYQSDEMLSILGPEVVRGLLDSLSNEGKENIATLKVALEKQRFEVGERAAHALKSSSKALGLLALSESMTVIETQLARRELPQITVLDQASTAFEEGLALLREHLLHA